MDAVSTAYPGRFPHEAYFSAEQPEATAYTRFSRQNGHQGRPQGAQCATGQRSKARFYLTGRDAGFSRDRRLFRPGEFDRVLKARDMRRDSGPLRILIKYNDLPHARLGLIVPKRWVRMAHDRNRYKRILREQFRLSVHRLPPADILIMVVKAPSENEVASAIRRVFEALCAS